MRSVIGGTLAVALLLSGCGGGDDDSDRASDTTTETTDRTTTTVERTTTTTEPPGPYAAGPIRVTTAEGWNFDFTPDLGRIEVNASKDISQSPPGQARVKLVLQSTGGRDCPGSFVSVDEGRENGADPAVMAVYARWNTPEMTAAINGPGAQIEWEMGDPIGYDPNCDLAPDDINENFHYGPGCELDDYERESGGLVTYFSEDAPEAAVDAFLAMDPFRTVPEVRLMMQTDPAYTYKGTPIWTHLYGDGTSQVGAL